MTTKSFFRTFGALALSLVLMLTLAGSVPAQTAHHTPPLNPKDKNYRSCGTIRVPQKDYWRSFIDGTGTTKGSHWIVAMRLSSSGEGTCTFAKHVATLLVTKDVNDFQVHNGHKPRLKNPSKVPGFHYALCGWQTGSNDHEIVLPFHRITCDVTQPISDDKKTVINVEAIADPRPPNIFPFT